MGEDGEEAAVADVLEVAVGTTKPVQRTLLDTVSSKKAGTWICKMQRITERELQL